MGKSTIFIKTRKTMRLDQPFLLKLTSLVLFISLVQTENANRRVVKVYYEMLCPYTLDFFNDQLKRTVNIPNIDDIVEIQMIPYGFTWFEVDKNQVTHQKCHHGYDECFGNNIQVCALENQPRDDFHDFIFCVSNLVYGSNYMSSSQSKISQQTAAIKCSKRLKFRKPKWQPVLDCINNITIKRDYSILEKYEKMTRDAEIKFTPYITVDDYWSELIDYETKNDLLGFICHVHKGPKPDMCASKGVLKEELERNQKKIMQDSEKITREETEQIIFKKDFKLINNLKSDEKASIKETNKIIEKNTSEIDDHNDRKKNIMGYQKTNYKHVNKNIQNYMETTNKLINKLLTSQDKQNSQNDKNWKLECDIGEKIFGTTTTKNSDLNQT